MMSASVAFGCLIGLVVLALWAWVRISRLDRREKLLLETLEDLYRTVHKIPPPPPRPSVFKITQSEWDD